ncbi:hypothetical protein ILUMI_12331 [Ignelater luminosus]|uniref:Uncharacterized protein n=1 Tax=Ignelater luminosus TaxID=2038154 RepID=A0A8K0D0I8_IGNLU|nr:hypothetical protein ILUMI_12331 [Ignelater luminosus]
MFAEKPYWRPDYADDISNLLTQIPELFERVKRFVTQNENEAFMKGSINTYRQIYLTECNCGGTGTLTMEETELVLQKDYNSLERNQKKTRNLSEAITYLFGESLYVDALNHEFDIDLAKTLNGIVN